MKKILAVILAAMLAFAGAAFAEGGSIGIALPDQDVVRWERDGAFMKAALEAAGYEVTLVYSDGRASRQAEDIGALAAQGVDVLLFAPVEGAALGDALAAAREGGARVIAYDSLPTDTAAIDCYVGFDSRAAGAMQGAYIVEKSGLADGKTCTMEVFAGSPDDEDALRCYDGAWDVLEPYVKKGTLVVKSGQDDFQTCAILDWDGDYAGDRMEKLIAAHYDGSAPDIVLCPNDVLALGVVEALQNAGIPAEDFPLITGQDCDLENVRCIAGGFQAMSVFRDPRALSEKLVEVVGLLVQEEEAPLAGDTTYDNGMKAVPAFICAPAYADAGNYRALLVDSAYYSVEQIDG